MRPSVVSVLAASDFDVAEGDLVVGNRLGTDGSAGESHPGGTHAESHAAHSEAEIGESQHLVLVVAPLPIDAGEQLRLLGILERVEVCRRAVEPYRITCGLDEIGRHQSTRPRTLRRLDHEEGQHLSDRIQDDPAEVAADAVLAADLCSDSENR